MARPSAASSRIEPSEMPAKASPSHSPQARRFSTASRPMPASRRMTGSAGSALSAQVNGSTALSPRTMNTCLPEVCISPWASAFSTTSALGSPSATSAAIAARRSSPSPNARVSTAARSSASTGGAQHKKRAAETMAAAARVPPENTLGLFDGHQRRLVLLLVVAGNERTPRLGLDRSLGLPHHVELAVGLHLADEHGLVQVMVLLVHLGRDARGRREGLAGHRRGHLLDVEALRLLDRLLPHVHADVSRFHRIVGERLVLVAGDVLRLGIRGPLLDELGVGRRLDRHELVPRREVPDARLWVDTAPVFLAD